MLSCLSRDSISSTTEKMKFSIKDFSSKCYNPQHTADLVAFTGEILNGKLPFLCSARVKVWILFLIVLVLALLALATKLAHLISAEIFLKINCHNIFNMLTVT